MKSFKVLFSVAAIAMFTIYSCKNKPAPILGTWVTSARYHNKGQEYKETYKFLTDSTFRLSYTVADSATGKDLGYRFASSGRFRVNGDRLMLYKMISMADTVKGSDYVIMPRLKFIRADSMRNYTITLNPGGTSFNITGQSCPPLVNCKGKFDYIKQLELDTTKRK